MTDEILSICPAPSGLVAVFKATAEGYPSEHREPVAALGIVVDPEGNRYAVALVIDAEIGTLSQAADANDFDRLEWEQGVNPCSKSCAPQ